MNLNSGACVAALHIQNISASAARPLSTTPALTLGKLPGRVALHAVWMSGWSVVADLRAQTKACFLPSSESWFISVCFSGFSFDRDHQLYFDDTCVVPERLEGNGKRAESKRTRFYVSDHGA